MIRLNLHSGINSNIHKHMIRVLISNIFLFMIICGAIAQTNDHCSGALPLEITGACSFGEYSNVNATSEADTLAPDPSCGAFRGGMCGLKPRFLHLDP